MEKTGFAEPELKLHFKKTDSAVVYNLDPLTKQTEIDFSGTISYLDKLKQLSFQRAHCVPVSIEKRSARMKRFPRMRIYPSRTLNAREDVNYAEPSYYSKGM